MAAAAEQMRPWLRGSVERCIFGRVGGPLWQLYKGRNSAEDAQYADKVRALGAGSDEVVLNILQVREVFQGLGPGFASLAWSGAAEGRCCGDGQTPSVSTTAGTQDLMSESQRFAETLDGSESPVSGSLALGPVVGASTSAYARASAALTRVELALSSGRGCTPRQAVEALELAQLEMKTCAFEASGGRAELMAMDDIVPVFVFVLLRSSIARPFACARFLRDALSPDERLDVEGRAVQLLESAARHVAFDWKLEEEAPVRCEPSAESTKFRL